MKTPPHLEGLIGALIASEEACKGTNFGWLLRQDQDGYTAMFTDLGGSRHVYHASTPAGALSRALMEFKLRTKRSDT